VEGIACIGRDITERLETMDMLRGAQARIAALRVL
jgi:hypothetical protein